MATSLDEEVVEMWTFYSAAGKERFTVPEKAAKLSGIFKTMIDNSENEKAVSLQIVDQIVDGSDEVYQINTDNMLQYVYDYFKLWEEDTSKADYVEVAPVQTSELTHVLQEKDIRFIQNYLDNEMPEFKGSEQQIRRKRIETLGKLLSQVDEFLDIQSLSNKIYTYIAVLVWNTSIVDFSDALKDPIFKAAQDAAIAQWEKDNPNKFANYVRSHTTGSSYLAPHSVLEISDEDLNTTDDVGASNLNADTEDVEDSDAEDVEDVEDVEGDSEPESEPE